jgi:hypothetical protein
MDWDYEWNGRTADRHNGRRNTLASRSDERSGTHMDRISLENVDNQFTFTIMIRVSAMKL